MFALETIPTVNLHLGNLRDKITLDKGTANLFDNVVNESEVMCGIFTGPLYSLLKNKLNNVAKGKRVMDLYDLTGDMGGLIRIGKVNVNLVDYPNCSDHIALESAIKVNVILINESEREIDTRTFYLM